ncbi:MAG: hypothetical protein AB9869_09855 [Verrucomicrobiia bacterium]
MKTETRSFTGWADFIDLVRRPPSPDVDAHSTHDRQEWTWTKDYDEALRLAMTGWAEGFRQVTVRADAIARAQAGLEMTSHYAEAGDEVDVGLYLTGEPECMIEFPLEPKRKPVVRFVVSAAFSARVDAEAIYNRGAAVLAAIDVLESAGVRVELDLDESIEADRREFRRTIPLKAADDPVDRDKLAFAICHPSTLRRLIFRLHEQEGIKRWREMGGGSYGRPRNPKVTDAVVIPCMRGNDGFASQEEATAFANALIQQAMASAQA